MKSTTGHLHDFAGIICYIDFDKNQGGSDIEASLAHARSLIDKMKMEPMDIGELPTLLDIIDEAQAALPKGMEKLRQAIVITHAEIERLAGDEAHMVYAREVAA